MPLYEYRCPTCKEKTERIVPYHERDTQRCDECVRVMTRMASRINVCGGPTSTKTLWDTKLDRDMAHSQGKFYSEEKQKNEDRYFQSIGMEG